MKRFAALLTCAALATPAALFADGLSMSSMNRSKLFSSQLDVLDRRAASQYSGSTRLQPKHSDPLFGGGETPAKRFAGRYSGPYLDMARAAARRNGVPEDLFLRLVQQESGWNARARSHKGALGLAQLMPATARRLKVDPLKPEENLEGGARYLKRQYLRFRSWRLALAAYNAGPEAVEKYGGVPPYEETSNYVRVIWGS